jgi:hypothetical protein
MSLILKDYLHDDYFDISLALSDKNSGFKWYSKLTFGHFFIKVQMSGKIISKKKGVFYGCYFK